MAGGRLFGKYEKIGKSLNYILGIGGSLASIVAFFMFREGDDSVKFFFIVLIAIIVVLTTYASFLQMKLDKAQKELDRFKKNGNGAIENVLIKAHNINHNLRNTLANGTRNDYSHSGLTKKMTKEVFLTIMNQLSELIKEEFRIRNITDVDDLKFGICIKSFVSVKHANMINRESERTMKIETKWNEEEGLITLFRDQATFDNKERESAGVLYSFDRQENTAFDYIVHQKKRFFMDNDLKKRQQKGNYQNQNKRWRDFYNATAVVPIRSNNQENDKIYGILAIDSLNRIKNPKFFNRNTVQALNIGADLLALFFFINEKFLNKSLEDIFDDIIDYHKQEVD